MKTIRLTMAQAVIRYLKNQYVERDGKQNQFFGGVWGIFGHGNVAGLGQALQQNPDFRFYPSRNEQAQVHLAAAYAKMNNRLKAFACTSSIGPGATNMITGAAVATINHLPVLLMPGDIFARRNVAPVLQQLEADFSQDISVNDCFKPVSRYWDRINRPDQILASLPEVMRVLTSPADTGAVTLALPQDVQAQAYDYPVQFFEPRVWHIPRQPADRVLLQRSLEWIRASKSPLIIAGGGVHYSEAYQALAEFAARTGIPVAETQAGKGALLWGHSQLVGAVGVTGTLVANQLAHAADLIIGIGTRYSDFTSASKTAFQNPDVRFINLNVAEFDAYKHAALPLVADARLTLEEWIAGVADYRIPPAYADEIARGREAWDREVDRLYHLGTTGRPAQSEVIGALNELIRPQDVIINAAGSAPGDLHKLWRSRDVKSYHMEYGYSCMGYEIPGALGIKMADPSREVYALVGDGTFLMMPSEIITSIQEGYKLNIILVENRGYASIGSLSGSIGSSGFGTVYRQRDAKTGHLTGEYLPLDFAALGRGFGAEVIEAESLEEFCKALQVAQRNHRTTLIVVHTDTSHRVPGYESWWDVPIAEVSEMEEVKAARQQYEEMLKKERYFF
ncbi:MAG: 3D-(3,5/4)-trihydroxycyclohexane-1,2-dione acylhydrolase (decyclizing) [Anaerolineae bacterium]|nr:3D-(3,5/4)-trihydroxycyclohexane-1,2-dione acylhydrolase (decyclizing) [Anaerolineae bacterium]